jgi:hypothetical protein
MTDQHTTRLDARARARVAELREQAETLRRRAEMEITALLTAADEIERLLTPPAEETPTDG